MAFLGREYRVLAVFVLVVAVLLAWANAGKEGSSMLVGLSVLAGAVTMRVGAYTVMLASMGWRDPRYIQCFTPLLVPLALLGAMWLGEGVGMFARRSARKGAPTAKGR